MPVSIFNDTVSAAIRDSLTTLNNNTSNGGNNNNSIHKTDEQLISSTKLMLLNNKIEYVETVNYKTTQDILKSKYVYLKAQPNNTAINNNNSSVNGASTNSNGNKVTLIEKENKPNLITENGVNKSVQITKEARLPVPKRILFPRESVQIGWKNSVRKWKIGAGMINVGNTCYLNSALQALFHVPAFANWLISDSGHRDKCLNQDTCIVCQMAETLLESQKNDVNTIKPWKIYSKLRLICRHFVPGRQEDAHEFLRYLIDAMEKSYLARFKNSKELDQHSKETTPLNQILGGYLRSAVRCLACGHVSTTFQHFEEIILDIRKSNTIEEALNLYFARERLEDMGYTCESCKKKVSATKQFSLERAPVVLCIQLKRFIIGSKLNKHVAIRTKLDLTPYSSVKNKVINGASCSSLQLNYKLVSMVTHLGPSQHSGHYTAIGLTDSNGYYQFDDSCVRQISVQNVLNTNAYVIFYELDNTHPNCTATSASSTVEKENGYHNNNHVSSTVTAPSTNSFNINRNINNNNNNSNENKIGFIGPMLPPKNNQPNSVTSTTTTLTSGSVSVGLKPLTNGIHSGSKLVLNNKSSNTASPVVNTFNGLKRANSVDSNIEITKTTPEKKPNLVLLNNIKTLPSMPKLIDESSTATNNTSSVVSSVVLNGNGNAKKQNGLVSPSKPISLVPYDSNDDSDNNDSDDNKSTTIITTTSTVLGNSSSSTINKNACLSSDTDDDENDDYDEEEANTDTRNNNNNKNGHLTNGVTTVKKHNITATTIISTKAGVWEVSEIEETEEIQVPQSNNNKTHNNHNNNNSTVKNNTFKFNSKYSVNNKKTTTNSNENGLNTVSQLLKMGHRGYGANIQSWNGGKSIIQKEVLEDKREERKRIKEDELENEMDRGRIKKIKLHGLTGADNPGFNQFQEIQNQQLQNNSKWHNDKFNGRIFRQNKHHHHHHHHNRHNNNYRNRNFNSNHRGNHQKRDNHHR